MTLCYFSYIFYIHVIFHIFRILLTYIFSNNIQFDDIFDSLATSVLILL